MGTKEGLIICILAHLNAAQLNAIKQAYAQTYNEGLLKALDKELSSEFEMLVLLRTLDPVELDALMTSEATKLFTKNQWIHVEVACTRSTADLFKIRQAYHARFKKSIEEDVAHHTSGNFHKLLVPIVSTLTYEGDEVNMMLAKSEAKILHAKVSNKVFNAEELIRILSTRSKAQLNANLNHYNNEYGNPINKNLKTDPKEEYLKLLRDIVKCLTVPQTYSEKSYPSCRQQSKG